MNADIPAAAALRNLLAMPAGEVRSRRNAWKEVQEAGAAVLDLLTLAASAADAQFDMQGSAALETEELTAFRALRDAQQTGQARPLSTLVVIEPRGAEIIDMVDNIDRAKN